MNRELSFGETAFAFIFSKFLAKAVSAWEKATHTSMLKKRVQEII